MVVHCILQCVIKIILSGGAQVIYGGSLYFTMCNKDYSLSKEAHSTVPQLQCKQSCVSIWTWTPKAFVPLQGTQSTDSYTLINITLSHFKGPWYHTWINSLAHLPQDARQDIHSSESRWHKKHRSLSLSLSSHIRAVTRHRTALHVYTCTALHVILNMTAKTFAAV